MSRRLLKASIEKRLVFFFFLPLGKHIEKVPHVAIRIPGITNGKLKFMCQMYQLRKNRRSNKLMETNDWTISIITAVISCSI